MQKDFEQWITVMIKHKQSTGSKVNSSAAPQQQAATQNMASTDKRVNENLAAFYKARDAIYDEVSK